MPFMPLTATSRPRVFPVVAVLCLLMGSTGSLGQPVLKAKARDMERQFVERLRAALDDAARRSSVGASIAVVPLTTPLLTGPATISTMIIYADKTRHWWELGVLVVYGLIIGLVVWLAFSLSERIAGAIDLQRMIDDEVDRHLRRALGEG